MAKRKTAQSELSRLSGQALNRLWVAARLHGVPSASFEKFSKENFGIEVSYKKAWGSAGGLQARWRDEPDQPIAKESDPDALAAAALWAWLLVDEPAFSLLRVLYRLPNDGLPRPDLPAALGALVGVRQVFEVSSDREVLVIALVENMDEAHDLRSRIEDHAVGQPVRMDLISHEDHQPARGTWLALTRRQFGRDLEESA